MKSIFQGLRKAWENGKDCVICSVIASSGSTPRGRGAKMLVLSDGSSIGTIGGGAVEGAAMQMAAEALKKRSNRIKGFDLSSGDRAELGMICGGNATVYFQFVSAGNPSTKQLLDYYDYLCQREEDAWLVSAVADDAQFDMGIWAEGELHFAHGITKEQVQPHLSTRTVLAQGEPILYVEPLICSGRVYIFGGGHVGQALARVIVELGFRPVVFEDRERFADSKLFPDGVQTVLGDFSRLDDHITIKPQDYVVIVTRGHEKDYTVLEQTLRSKAGYVGLIGSRNKMARTKELLRQAGIQEKEFERIHNPIGLDIGAETPAELAISIAAELILNRSQR